MKKLILITSLFCLNFNTSTEDLLADYRSKYEAEYNDKDLGHKKTFCQRIQKWRCSFDNWLDEHMFSIFGGVDDNNSFVQEYRNVKDKTSLFNDGFVVERTIKDQKLDGFSYCINSKLFTHEKNFSDKI